ncbi:MAG: hypothetical protein JST92_22310 [Deltaproteobacteria bacterium]|nr:hypothetical protein [Deltaproteobacteria bacterium]
MTRLPDFAARPLTERRLLTRLVVACAASYAGFFTLVRALPTLGLGREGAFYLVAIVIQLAPTVLCLWRAARESGRPRRMFLLAGLAQAAMTASTIGYAVSLLWLTPATVSPEQAMSRFLLGDIPSVLSVPLLLAAALALPRASERAWGSLRDAVDGLMVAFGFFLSAWPFLLRPLLHDGLAAGRQTYSVLSSFGDVALLGTLAFVAARPSRTPWPGAAITGVGLGLTALAGLAQWIQYVHPSLGQIAPVVDPLFVLASATMSAGALQLRPVEKGPFGQRWDKWLLDLAQVLRALPLTAAALAMVLFLVASTAPFDSLMGLLLLGIAVLVVLGDQLALREVRGLTNELQRDNEALQRAQVEIARLNLALGEQVQRLEQTNRELESFSHSVSHDLRAPLRAIDGFARALDEDHGETLGADGRFALSRIRAGSQRLGQIINDLLSLSRMSRGPLKRAPIDVSALAQQVAEALQKSAPARTIEWVIAPGLAVEGDPGLIRLLLENLLGNAWKYSSKKPRARIELGVRDDPRGRTFFVRDDGAGFDMAYAGKLFKPFERLHAQSDFEGTGIGLATVQRIVLRHGGRIWAEAAPGQGATFSFTLA